MKPDPIRVVHLITELNTGGAEQMLYKVITRMNRDRFRSVVITMTDRGPVGSKIAAEGFPLFELGMTQGRPSVEGAWGLYRILYKERPHILQTWLYHADLLGTLVGKIAPVGRVVWSIRCSQMELKNYRVLTAVTLKMCSLLSRCADAVIVNSERGKTAHLTLGYRPRKIITIPNGFDTALFRPDPGARTRLLSELGLGSEAFLIGQVARFDPMKDHSNFLRAAASLLTSKKDIHFVLVGKGMVPDNPGIIKYLDSSLQEKVHLLGPREDVSKLTPGFDVATSSSAYGEGFSNTIGEAMACGVPCVVTDVGDSAAIVGDTGMAVPPRDAGALAGAWRRLMEMGKEDRRELGERARKRIEEKYEIGIVVRQLEQFYESVMPET